MDVKRNWEGINWRSAERQLFLLVKPSSPNACKPRQLGFTSNKAAEPFLENWNKMPGESQDSLILSFAWSHSPTVGFLATLLIQTPKHHYFANPNPKQHLCLSPREFQMRVLQRNWREHAEGTSIDYAFHFPMGLTDTRKKKKGGGAQNRIERPIWRNYKLTPKEMEQI